MNRTETLSTRQDSLSSSARSKTVQIPMEQLPREDSRGTTLYALSQTSLEHAAPSTKSENLGSQSNLISHFVLTVLFKNGRTLGVEAQRAIILAFVQCVVINLLEIIILSFLSMFIGPTVGYGGENKKAGFLLVYALLFIVGQLFYTMLVFDAARNKNTVQVIGTAIFNVAMFFYSGLQVFQLHEHMMGHVNISTHDDEVMYWIQLAYPIAVTLSVFMGLFCLGGSWMAYKVFREYGWNLFENHGASLSTKRMLRTYNIFAVLLKFSVYFNFGIIIQVIAAMLFDQIDSTTPAFTSSQVATIWSVASVLVLIALLYYHLGYYAVIRCSTTLMVSFLIMISLNVVGLSVGMVYTRDFRFKFTILTLSFFIYVTLALNVATFGFGILCWSYFKTGLKPLGMFLNI